MNLQKNGNFIAEMRKKQNLTQKQLAEQIGVSDKTVSKWECGKGFPDVDIMLPLCQCLKFNINELISGESILPEEYLGKAEQNMVELVKAKETEKKRGKQGLAVLTLGISVLVVALLFLMMLGFDISRVVYYIDVPSVIMIMGMTFIVLICMGQLKYFGEGFCYLLKKERKNDASKEELLRAGRAFGTAGSIMLLSGVLITLFSFIVVLQNLTPEYLGSNLAVSLLTMGYGILGKIICLILKEKVEYREG